MDEVVGQKHAPHEAHLPELPARDLGIVGIGVVEPLVPMDHADPVALEHFGEPLDDDRGFGGHHLVGVELIEHRGRGQPAYHILQPVVTEGRRNIPGLRTVGGVPLPPGPAVRALQHIALLQEVVMGPRGFAADRALDRRQRRFIGYQRPELFPVHFKVVRGFLSKLLVDLPRPVELGDVRLGPGDVGRLVLRAGISRLRAAGQAGRQRGQNNDGGGDPRDLVSWRSPSVSGTIFRAGRPEVYRPRPSIVKIRIRVYPGRRGSAIVLVSSGFAS